MAQTNRKIVFFPPRKQLTEPGWQEQSPASQIKFFTRPPVTQYTTTPLPYPIAGQTKSRLHPLASEESLLAPPEKERKKYLCEQQSEDKRSSGNMTSVLIPSTKGPSHFSRRMTQQSVQSEQDDLRKMMMKRPVERTISKMSDISRIPTYSDREIQNPPQVPSNLLTSYSRQQSMASDTNDEPIKIGILRARNSVTGKVPLISPPTSYISQEFIQGNIRMSGNQVDHTLMQIVRDEEPRRPEPRSESHYVFSDQELQDMAREFGSQIPSLDSQRERFPQKNLKTDFSIPTTQSEPNISQTSETEQQPDQQDEYNLDSCKRMLGSPRNGGRSEETRGESSLAKRRLKIENFQKALQRRSSETGAIQLFITKQSTAQPRQLFPSNQKREQDIDKDALDAEFNPGQSQSSIDVRHLSRIYCHNDESESSVKEDSLIQVQEQDAIERARLHQRAAGCQASRMFWQCEKSRRQCVRLSAAISNHFLFDCAVIIVILVDCVFYFMKSPDSFDWNDPFFLADILILFMYTLEMLIKVFGHGCLFGKTAYLREGWNVLDFVILLGGYVSFFLMLDGKAIKITILRVLRVLRPLRTISGIQGLRILVTAIISALPLLRDTAFILFIFELIFAIAGLHLWAGSLQYRCELIDDPSIIQLPDDSITLISQYLCGGSQGCAEGYVCRGGHPNPNHGVTSFDNIGAALLQTFQIMTLEGWSQIMVYLEQSFSQWVVLFFVMIVFVGSFFLLNLTLAVIKWQFSDAHVKKQEEAKARSIQRKKRLNKRRGFKVAPGLSGGEKLRKLISAQMVIKRGLKRRKEKIEMQRKAVQQKSKSLQNLKVMIPSFRGFEQTHTYNRVTG